MAISGLSIFPYVYWSFLFPLLWNSCSQFLLLFLLIGWNLLKANLLFLTCDTNLFAHCFFSSFIYGIGVHKEFTFSLLNFIQALIPYFLSFFLNIGSYLLLLENLIFDWTQTSIEALRESSLRLLELFLAFLVGLPFTRLKV